MSQTILVLVKRVFRFSFTSDLTSITLNKSARLRHSTLYKRSTQAVSQRIFDIKHSLFWASVITNLEFKIQTFVNFMYLSSIQDHICTPTCTANICFWLFDYIL